MGITATRTIHYNQKGEKGAVLRGPQAWSDCDMGYAFQSGSNGDRYLDTVVYGDNYYTCKIDHVKTADNYPGSTVDTNNGYWQLGDKVGLIATNLLLSAYALIKNLGAEAIEMKGPDGNVIFEAKDGNVTCKTGTFENVTVSGILKGVSGTFETLRCIDSDGNTTGEISFGEKSGISFNNCDLNHHGIYNSRALRYYASDIRCRGMLGVKQHSFAVVTGRSIRYYVNGNDINSYVTISMSSFISSDGHSVYKIPLYPYIGDSAIGNCTVNDTLGFPVDVILINNTSGEYYYELDGAEIGKTVTIVNVNDQFNSNYIGNNKAWRNLCGGGVHQYINIGTIRSPSIDTSTIGYDWICISSFDNDWS